MVGTWTYDSTNNIITVVGGTAGAPCTFLDSWNADKAGTYELVHTRNIVAADGAPVAVNHALRPTDYIMLGRADLYLTVTNFILDSTIQIVGTDYLGNAVSEDIAITGNGVYNTIEVYKTVTSTQVTVYGDSFTYKMTQGQWGVVWKQATNQYAFDGRLAVGNGTTATYFADTNKLIVFNDSCATADYQFIIDLKNAVTFTLGNVVDATDKVTDQGCTILSLINRHQYLIVTVATPYVQFYSCMFMTIANVASYIHLKSNASTHKIWNCRTSHTTFHNTVADWFNLDVTGSNAYGLLICTGTFDTVRINNIQYALYTNTNITMSNIVAQNNTTLIFFNAVATVSLINSVVDTWTFDYDGHASLIYCQYTFDLQVTDIAGVAIGTATVELKDKFGAVVFSVSTAADGTIAQQTVSRGYYAQATANTLQEYSPHTFTITKATYQTYTHKFTLDEKIDWRIALLPAGHVGGKTRIKKVRDTEMEDALTDALAITLIQKRKLKRAKST